MACGQCLGQQSSVVANLCPMSCALVCTVFCSLFFSQPKTTLWQVPGLVWAHRACGWVVIR